MKTIVRIVRYSAIAGISVILVLAFVAGALIVIQSGVDEPTPEVAVPVDKHPNVSELYVDVNNERAKAGLTPLKSNAALTRSATAKCAAMAELNVWAHDLPDGRTPFTFIQAQLTHYDTASENIAYNPGLKFNSQDTVNSWMNSASHKAAILNPVYTDVGYAICSAKDFPDMVVQHFAANPSTEVKQRPQVLQAAPAPRGSVTCYSQGNAYTYSTQTTCY
jgi:hypothetical protein